VIVGFTRSALFALVTAVVALGPSSIARAGGVSSLTSAPVTVYSAKWCGACRSLQNGLADRKIAFESVDVDDNPAAFSRAKAAAGAGNAIPLTSIVRSSNTVWIVGADVDAVDRAQRGE
jgi:glutaredoxin